MRTDSLQEFSSHFAEYTELRMQENHSLNIFMIDGNVIGNEKSTAGGISARVYKNGCWGFASHPDESDASVMKVIESAKENATFLDARLNDKPIVLPSAPADIEKNFGTKKPRKSQREIIEFLNEIDGYIKAKCHRLSSRTMVMRCLDMEKNLYTSDHSRSYSLVPRAIMILSLTAEKDGTPYELHEAIGGRGQFEDVFENPTAVYPKVDQLYEDLLRKTDGVYANAGSRDCVLSSDIAGILAHEAIGHTTEADYVMSGSIAGENVGEMVATSLVTLIDFANEALDQICPVPVYIDDEGILAEDAVLIEHGVLKGFMHNRETAERFGAKPTGNARAYTFSDEPLIRMRNTGILPGKDRVDDMIASIDDGYYMIRSNSGQADATGEFMFGISLGYEIKNGKLGSAIRDTTISGVAFDMLKTVSMVSDDMSWSCAGMCGKKQVIPVGMGGPAMKCSVTIGGR